VDSLHPDVSSLSIEERTKLAKEWIETGKSEHASVSSFALFAQKLLAISAPPELIAEALQCAREEIDHAMYAFTLASAYSGDSVVVPSTYNTHTMVVTPDLKLIIEETINEGCIQETIAALDACRTAHAEHDPVVKLVWDKVIEDEAHHAAFAWKVVKWAIERDSSSGNGGPNVAILELLNATITPATIKKLGKGAYLKEDIELICAIKQHLLLQYNTTTLDRDTTQLLNNNGVLGDNRVIEKIMEVFK